MRLSLPCPCPQQLVAGTYPVHRSSIHTIQTTSYKASLHKFRLQKSSSLTSSPHKSKPHNSSQHSPDQTSPNSHMLLIYVRLHLVLLATPRLLFQDTLRSKDGEKHWMPQSALTASSGPGKQMNPTPARYKILGLTTDIRLSDICQVN
jgi:hypothetical protein